MENVYSEKSPGQHRKSCDSPAWWTQDIYPIQTPISNMTISILFKMNCKVVSTSQCTYSPSMSNPIIKFACMVAAVHQIQIPKRQMSWAFIGPHFSDWCFNPLLPLELASRKLICHQNRLSLGQKCLKNCQ